jgi:hypothetical protein
MVSSLSNACVEWAAARAAPGRRDSADEFCVRQFETHTTIAVLDNLGHRQAAAMTAEKRVRLLKQAQGQDDALELVARYRGSAK